jgi:hypothetical protein
MDLFEEILKVLSPDPVKANVVETTEVKVQDNISKEVTQLKSEQKILESKTFVKKPMYLNLKYSSSINLGNFQSAKVEKGLMIPVGIEADPTVVEQIKATDLWASDLLSKLVDKEVQPILDAVKKKNATS